jgi:hypothetical protein
MKKLLTFLITIIVIIAIPIGVIKFMLLSGKKLDTNITDTDYKLALTKTKVKIADINDINIINLGEKKFTAKGKVKIDSTFTNNEFSSLMTKANETSGPISNIKVNFLGNGKLETSFKLSKSAIDYIKNNDAIKNLKIPGFSTISAGLAPAFTPETAAISLPDFLVNFITSLANNTSVYASGSLVRNNANKVTVRIDTLTIGKINMSSDVINRVEQGVTDFVNMLITSGNGFHIEELKIENGKLHYKGTLPAQIM